MFAESYAGKKVFITGHTGFKGSWLTAWLIRLGASVTGFANGIPTKPSCFEELDLGARVQHIIGDVRNGEEVLGAMEAGGADIVFHLAAQPIVRSSYEDPVYTFETNILGTLNVLEAIRKLKRIKAAVIITSDKCYRNEEWVWGYREIDALGGNDPYSASKACAEILAHSYFSSYFQTGTACATTRAGNVIGGGDWAKDRIVPDCARAWAAGEAVRIRSPNATRPWQHVLEPLSGYLWLGARLLDNECGGSRSNPAGESYNFGPPADVKNPVADVVRALAPFWPGFTYCLQEADAQSKKESGLLKLCCDKALAQLDWKACLTFEETIAFTANWYAAFYGQSGNMWDVTQTQIANYEKLAKERGILWANL